MEIRESHPQLGQPWCVSFALAQRSRTGNRSESEREHCVAPFGTDSSQEATAQAQLSYAIALPLYP